MERRAETLAFSHPYRAVAAARCTLRRMCDHPQIRAVFLGSGSAGNATAICFGSDVLLVDCGLSAREVSRRLESAGLHASRVRAIFVTHEHGDHVRGLDVFVRRHAPGCTLYASRGTRVTARLSDLAAEVRTLDAGEETSVAGVTVRAFALAHDATDPTGFRFDAGGDSVGLATDTGHFTPQAAETLAGVHVLGIESNHDSGMLDRGPYPAYLKHRIRSHHGHLSNDDASRALERVASDGLRCVVGLHRSHTNNTPALAAAALETGLARLGIDVPVMVAPQDGVCDSDPARDTLFTETP